VRIEELTGDSPAELLERWYAVYESVELGWDPHRPTDGLQYAVNDLRHGSGDRDDRVHLAVDDDGVPLGYTHFWTQRSDNLHRIDGMVLLHRALEAGRHEEVFLELMRTWLPHLDGRRVAAWEVVEGDPEAALIARLGATCGMREQHNVLELASIDREALVTSIAESALRAEAAGYELVQWTSPCPEELLDDYADMCMTMNTAPRDDLDLEDFLTTPAKIREIEARWHAKGREVWVVTARHRDSGRLVAFTELGVGDDRPHRIEQEDTAVKPEHRGHGLGYWIKSVNIERALRERPQAQTIQTWNADSNSHMVAVNRRLGFVCERYWQDWELPTSALPSALSSAL
jgi:GNAT superfamily N-acetyltransferase